MLFGYRTPDAPAPGGGPAPSKDDSDEETSSASSFSDDDWNDYHSLASNWRKIDCCKKWIYEFSNAK